MEHLKKLKFLINLNYASCELSIRVIDKSVQCFSILFFLAVYTLDFSSVSDDRAYPFSLNYLGLVIFLLGITGVSLISKGKAAEGLSVYFLVLFVPAKIWSWVVYALFLFFTLPVAFKIDGEVNGSIMKYINLIGFILVNGLPFLLIAFFIKRIETRINSNFIS